MFGGFSVRFGAQPSSGYLPHLVWMMPLKSGAISSRLRSASSGTLSGSITQGRNLNAALTGSGSIMNAALGLIVSLSANLSGSSTLAANVIGRGVLSAALSGLGSLSAVRSAIGHLVAALSGVGSIAATATAKGYMAADITVTGSTLTTANVGAAVWAEILESSGIDSFTASRILRIIAATTAGKSSGGPGTPTFRNLGDTQNQVVATADADGDRSPIVYGS